MQAWCHFRNFERSFKLEIGIVCENCKKIKVVFRAKHDECFYRTPSCGCDSAAVAAAAAAAAAAAVRGEVAGILEKSHKVEKNWKNSI